jgi:hypothetical protein
VTVAEGSAWFMVLTVAWFTVNVWLMVFCRCLGWVEIITANIVVWPFIIAFQYEEREIENAS